VTLEVAGRIRSGGTTTATTIRGVAQGTAG
jgi:hypothetical protein